MVCLSMRAVAGELITRAATLSILYRAEMCCIIRDVQIT